MSVGGEKELRIIFIPIQLGNQAITITKYSLVTQSATSKITPEIVKTLTNLDPVNCDPIPTLLNLFISINGSGKPVYPTY